jgi:di/tricarboxylate transporter
MSDQFILSLTLAGLLISFIWSKLRYDALTIGALMILIAVGVIPASDAFLGFSHPAVLTVALVLVISQGLKNSGLTGLVGKLIGTRKFSELQFLIFLLLIAAFLSSFINNIGALAILLPITLNVCQKMDWHPSRFLMPLAFACILGGMNTTIGTPPNIIISEYKASISNSPFSFFDYSYVGLVVTLLGIIFITFIGRNFILLRNDSSGNVSLINLKGYLFEVEVNKKSNSIGS